MENTNMDMPKEDVVEAYNEEVKIPREAHKKQMLLPAWAYVLIGAAGCGILMLLLNYAGSGWNMPGERVAGRNLPAQNNLIEPDSAGKREQRGDRYSPLFRPMAGRGVMRDAFLQDPFFSFDEDFRRMQENFNQMEQVHRQMMQRALSQPADYTYSMVSSNDASGKSGNFTFSHQGKIYSLPYSVENNSLTLKTQELMNYLSANRNANVNIKISDSGGKVLAQYYNGGDFKNDIVLKLDAKKQYELEVLVQDEKGNQVMLIRQSV